MSSKYAQNKLLNEIALSWWRSTTNTAWNNQMIQRPLVVTIKICIPTIGLFRINYLSTYVSAIEFVDHRIFIPKDSKKFHNFVAFAFDLFSENRNKTILLTEYHRNLAKIYMRLILLPRCLGMHGMNIWRRCLRFSILDFYPQILREFLKSRQKYHWKC